jgi:hypothetical protein
VVEHETLVRNGREIGHDTLQCTAIHGPPTTDFRCVGTLVLGGGEVTFQGATDFSEIRVAISGGTKRYIGAYGELVVHDAKLLEVLKMIPHLQLGDFERMRPVGGSGPSPAARTSDSTAQLDRTASNLCSRLTPSPRGWIFGLHECSFVIGPSVRLCQTAFARGEYGPAVAKDSLCPGSGSRP